jgi:DNA-binding NtrC family response regulator
LRERREDIMPLARHFAGHVWSANPAATFSPEAVRLLEQYPWPGNVRELENAVVHAVALCGNVVRPADLPERVRDFRPPQQEEAEAAEEHLPLAGGEWPKLSEVEGRYVARVLAHTGGNKQAAARLLGVDRKTLERMIKRHNLTVQK